MSKQMNELVLYPNVIEALFERTNFGGAEKTDVGRRGLMCECVLKRAYGYHDGHTITTICKDAGLLRQDATPAAGGVRWAFDQLYHSGGGATILERLQNAPSHHRIEATYGEDGCSHGGCIHTKSSWDDDTIIGPLIREAYPDPVGQVNSDVVPDVGTSWKSVNRETVAHVIDITPTVHYRTYEGDFACSLAEFWLRFRHNDTT